jgi:hypothetical protein
MQAVVGGCYGERAGLLEKAPTLVRGDDPALNHGVKTADEAGESTA